MVHNILVAGHVHSYLLEISEANPSRDEAHVLRKQLHVDNLSHLIDERKNAARDEEKKDAGSESDEGRATAKAT